MFSLLGVKLADIPGVPRISYEIWSHCASEDLRL